MVVVGGMTKLVLQMKRCWPVMGCLQAKGAAKAKRRVRQGLGEGRGEERRGRGMADRRGFHAPMVFPEALERLM